MACGIVPAIRESPPPPSWPTATRRPASSPGRDDVGPGAHAEDLAAFADALAVTPSIPFTQVGSGGLGVDIGRNRSGCRGELLAQATQLQDLVAQRGGSLELEVSRRFLHLRLEASQHRGQLLRLGALDLERRALLGYAPQPLVDVADRLG